MLYYTVVMHWSILITMFNNIFCREKFKSSQREQDTKSRPSGYRGNGVAIGYAIQHRRVTMETTYNTDV